MVPERSRKTGRSSRFSPDLVQHTPDPSPPNLQLPDSTSSFSLTASPSISKLLLSVFCLEGLLSTVNGMASADLDALMLVFNMGCWLIMHGSDSSIGTLKIH